MITPLSSNSFLFCCNRKCTTITLDSENQVLTINDNKQEVKVPYDEMVEICNFFLNKDKETEFTF